MKARTDPEARRLPDAQRARLKVLLGALPNNPGPDDPAWDQERLERMRRLDLALSQLSDEHRLIVLLHDTEGYKMTEIQELIGVPVGTIKSRLHRARIRLREILTADGTFF